MPTNKGHCCTCCMPSLRRHTPENALGGSLDQRAQRHKPKAKRGSSEKRVQIALKPFKEKETVRWRQTAEHWEEIKEHCQKTQLVMLADCECNITEVIDYCTRQQSFDWVLRSDIDRDINKSCKQDASIKVQDQLGNTKPLYRQQLSIRSREQRASQSLQQHPGKADRDARLVIVSVHAGLLTLNDPRVGHRNGISMGAILAQEIETPKDVQPVQWLLLTSLPIKTRKQVELVISDYLKRWMIKLTCFDFFGQRETLFWRVKEKPFNALISPEACVTLSFAI